MTTTLMVIAVLSLPAAIAQTPTNACENLVGYGPHVYVGSHPLPLKPYAYAPEPYVWDGNLTGDCDSDPLTFGDFDGHKEWGIGGAILHYGGNNHALCYPGYATDHAGHANIYVSEQVAFTGTPEFIVTSDVSMVPGATTPDCGDNFVDPCDDPGEIPGVTCTTQDCAEYSPTAPAATNPNHLSPVTCPVGIDGTRVVFIDIGADGIPQGWGYVWTN